MFGFTKVVATFVKKWQLVAKKKNTIPGLFDARVTLRGEQADKLREKLVAKKRADKRSTINNTIAAALLDHFKIS